MSDTPSKPGSATAARTFPCEGCGADLEFRIGTQNLTCPYCGHEKTIELADDAEVAEQDLYATLARLAERRGARQPEADSLSEVACDACGAVVQFTGTITSGTCAYCGAILQLDNVHDSPSRVPVDGVLPFMVPRDRAQQNLAAWVKSRWFAPNDFKARGIEGRFNGIYLPYWTFDSMTFTRYSGMRGDHYWVTVGTGKNKRREMRTRWTPASGRFQRFFDDVLVIAGQGLPLKRLTALEPWPLEDCAPFAQELLAGFVARTYDVPLDLGFQTGRQRMDQAIRGEVHQRIGGDVQVIHSLETRYDALTYKHLLLPVWMLAYRYKQKSYQVVVNAGTGEVQGDRPYSWIKILLAVLFGLAVAGVVWLLARH